ncbi:hypothetical protein, partial [Thiobacillus sp.]
MRIVTIIVTTLSLAACATSKPIQGPNGGTAYFIKCGSAVIDACYAEAAKVCPNGYTFVDKQNNPNAVALSNGS